MEYSEEFKEAIEFCKVKNLFLGYGNPNGKILMIGKEQYFNSISTNDTDEFYKELLEKRNKVNQININSWLKNINENFIPKWDERQECFCDDSNALTAWWNQKNKQNNKNNGGTSNTYLQYQKIYQNVFNDSIKQDNINFQKEFFITELSDLVAKKDYQFPRLKELKKGYVLERQELFKLPFFKSFPIIVIASGHYSKDFDVNLEKVFDVKWKNETTSVGKSWINLHDSSNPKNKKLLIHTRQLSTSVETELIERLSNEINKFLKSLI